MSQTYLALRIGTITTKKVDLDTIKPELIMGFDCAEDTLQRHLSAFLRQMEKQYPVDYTKLTDTKGNK